SAALLAGAIWMYQIFRDLRGGSEQEGESPEDLLTPLAEAFEEGQISEEEYLRIRESIEREHPGAISGFVRPMKPRPRPEPRDEV
ncbi:MAG: hypothetical protein U0835_14235, partial [Isosphaeraceae bacterium]